MLELRFFAAATLAVALSTNAVAQAPTPLSPGALESFVSGVVADAMAADHISGVQIAVVQSGRPILLKGYGAASRVPWRPVTPQTLFRLGSTGKTFTWIMVMREVEKGRLKLDDPVDAYLPQQMQFADEGFHNPIRIRDLMDHASGLEDLELSTGIMTDDPKKVQSLEHYLTAHRPRRVREAAP